MAYLLADAILTSLDHFSSPNKRTAPENRCSVSVGCSSPDRWLVARTSYRVRFQGGAGYELAGIVDRPDDQIACPVAVFSHCFTCNKDLKAIVRISRALADHGIAVLRYDMTGLGGSDGQFCQTNFSTNLADLTTAVHYANSQIGPVTSLVGHSFGGAVSLAYASQSAQGNSNNQNPIKAVVTLAAPSDTKHLATLLARMDPKIELTGKGQVTIGGISWDIDQQMLDDFHRHDLPHMIAPNQSCYPTVAFTIRCNRQL